MDRGIILKLNEALHKKYGTHQVQNGSKILTEKTRVELHFC
jgi:hypothetical protein